MLRCATTCSPRWRSARHATRLPFEPPLVSSHVRCAPHASAASLRRALKWRRPGPLVDAAHQRRHIQSQDVLAEHVGKFGLRHRVTAVPRHVETDERPAGVGAHRVRIRRFGLRCRRRLARDAGRGAHDGAAGSASVMVPSRSRSSGSTGLSSCSPYARQRRCVTLFGRCVPTADGGAWAAIPTPGAARTLGIPISPTWSRPQCRDPDRRRALCRAVPAAGDSWRPTAAGREVLARHSVVAARPS